MTKLRSSILPIGAAGVAIAAISWATPSHALITLGNQLYNASTNPFDGATGETTGISANIQQKAVAFNTGSTGWQINAITATLVGYENLDAPLIQLRADDGAGNPASTAILTFALPPSPAPTSAGNIGNFTFSASSAVPLAPNTTYWLLFSTSTSRIYNWVALNNFPSSVPTSTQGWNFTGYKFSDDGAVTWQSSTVQNAFNIDATPVPFGFTPIPGLIVSGFIWGANRLRRSRSNAIRA